MPDKPITKDNADQYFRELAKEIRKVNGRHALAEIVLVGGAAILINYGFRETTYDIDAVVNSVASIKQAMNNTGDRLGLPNGWLNTDFARTKSYSPRIMEFSKYYRTYSNIVTVRTITGEYLLVMKMMAGRQYKFDFSDIVGILWEQDKSGNPLTLSDIQRAAEDLYGSYEKLPTESRVFVERVISEKSYETLYQVVRDTEAENKSILLEYQTNRPGKLNSDNVNEIISAIKQKKEKHTD